MKPSRILVVEDERIIALHLRQQLTALGYEVPRAVASGHQALRWIEQAQPDLVLMDIQLTGELDGIATAAAIPPEYHIPVIFLTADSCDATLQRAAAANPHGYLLKPVSERELHAMIQMTLARCRNERAARALLESTQRTRKMDALRRLAGDLGEAVDGLLTALYGQLEVMGAQAIGERGVAEAIQDTFNEAIEKERLMHRLLDFSGRGKLAPATVALDDLISDQTGQLQLILGRSVQIRVAMANDLWRARIDPNRLRRALSLLVANARDAMPNGGNLTIECHNGMAAQHDGDHDPEVATPGGIEGNYVVLSVTDTGSGMSEAVIERAFEPFFTTKAPDAGTGLGLSLVFGFIRQSGGEISIDSTPREGTTVRLFIPAASDDAMAVTPDDADHPRPPRPELSEGAEQANENNPLSTGSATRWIQRNDVAVRNTLFSVPREARAALVPWHMAENALFASIIASTGTLRYRLIVEPLPRRDGWDWVVWRPGAPDASARHGRASSVVSGMAAAEDAARRWDEIEIKDVAPVDISQNVRHTHP